MFLRFFSRSIPLLLPHKKERLVRQLRTKSLVLTCRRFPTESFFCYCRWTSGICSRDCFVHLKKNKNIFFQPNIRFPSDFDESVYHREAEITRWCLSHDPTGRPTAAELLKVSDVRIGWWVVLLAQPMLLFVEDRGFSTQKVLFIGNGVSWLLQFCKNEIKMIELAARIVKSQTFSARLLENNKKDGFLWSSFKVLFWWQFSLCNKLSHDILLYEELQLNFLPSFPSFRFSSSTFPIFSNMSKILVICERPLVLTVFTFSLLLLSFHVSENSFDRKREQ